MNKGQHNPPHPGEVLWGLDMEPAGITVTALADRLDVDRKTISRIVNGTASITPLMAVRLAVVFETEPQLWLNLQAAYDIWHAERQLKSDLKKIKPFSHAQSA
jgi:antitoxin HigA-1